MSRRRAMPIQVRRHVIFFSTRSGERPVVYTVVYYRVIVYILWRDEFTTEVRVTWWEKSSTWISNDVIFQTGSLARIEWSITRTECDVVKRVETCAWGEMLNLVAKIECQLRDFSFLLFAGRNFLPFIYLFFPISIRTFLFPFVLREERTTKLFLMLDTYLLTY